VVVNEELLNTFGVNEFHRGLLGKEVDKKIVELVLAMNTAGFQTLNSCEDIDGLGSAEIQFKTGFDGAIQLLKELKQFCLTNLPNDERANFFLSFSCDIPFFPERWQLKILNFEQSYPSPDAKKHYQGLVAFFLTYKNRMRTRTAK
jgi:hypothetical protein